MLVTCPSRNETETGRNWQIAAEAEIVCKKCEIEDEQGWGRGRKERGDVEWREGVAGSAQSSLNSTSVKLLGN